MVTAPKTQNLQTSNLARVQPRSITPDMIPEKMTKTEVWSRDPVNFWPLSANSSKNVTDALQICHACCNGKSRPEPENFFRKEGVARVTCHLKFLGAKC